MSEAKCRCGHRKAIHHDNGVCCYDHGMGCACRKFTPNKPAEPSPEVAPMQDDPLDRLAKTLVSIKRREARMAADEADDLAARLLPAVAPERRTEGDKACMNAEWLKTQTTWKGEPPKNATPFPAVAPRETQTWEEALSEWWRTGVLSPKAVAIEDSFKAGWDAHARLGGC